MLKWHQRLDVRFPSKNGCQVPINQAATFWRPPPVDRHPAQPSYEVEGARRRPATLFAPEVFVVVPEEKTKLSTKHR